jgi:hypothetical protein
MPAKPPPPPSPPPEPAYPAIEGLIEWVTAEELEAFFVPVQEDLEKLKGPKAQQAKKIHAALESTQELLSQLLQIREKLTEAQGKGKPSK